MKVKTHLIVTAQWDDYIVKWVKRLIDIKPKLDSNGYPTFIVAANGMRTEMKTFNIFDVEAQAKRQTYPRGRGSLTSDTSYIYIVGEKQEILLGIITHNHVRKYSPMYDEL